jgi:hypothetical protein
MMGQPPRRAGRQSRRCFLTLLFCFDIVRTHIPRETFVLRLGKGLSLAGGEPFSFIRDLVPSLRV